MIDPDSTCSVCAHQCAFTETMWQNRQRNLRAAPDVAIHPCGCCGSTAWATTRKYIRMDEPHKGINMSGAMSWAYFAGLPFLTVAMIALRVFGIVNWSWWLIFSPVIIMAVIAAVVAAMVWTAASRH